jgi:hypothetical protein
MRSLSAPVLILLVALGTTCSQQGKQPPPPSRQPQEAAIRALETFKGLVTAQNYKAMGFESEDEVRTATLGEPLPVYHIRLDQLREYQPNIDPNKLLTDVGQMMYPVLAKEQVRSSLVIARAGDSWKEARYGGPNLGRALARVRAAHMATYQQPFTSYRVVQIPGLNVYFLGRRVDNKLVLIPVLDDARYNLKAGVAMPAEEVLRIMAEAAKKYNGLPI